MEKPKVICYMGLNMPTAPRDKVYLKALKREGFEVILCVDSERGFRKFWNLFKKHYTIRNKYDVLWVGYSSTIVVPLAWFVTNKRIIFNALSSWYENTILDRAVAKPISYKAGLIWLCDFLAFHLSHTVLVESQSQKTYLAETFFVKPERFGVVLTGADDEVFFPDETIKKQSRFTVLFRGMFLPATGVIHVLETAKLLKNAGVDFLIIGWGALLSDVEYVIQKEELHNVKLIHEFLPADALRELMLSCHVMLGQFGDHERLERTIQHKTFEALALGMPFITRDSKSNREILLDGKNCLFVPPADPKAIAEAIEKCKRDTDFRTMLGTNARRLYIQLFDENAFGQHLKKIVEKVLV